jgi:hypothetical protein
MAMAVMLVSAVIFGHVLNTMHLCATVSTSLSHPPSSVTLNNPPDPRARCCPAAPLHQYCCYPLQDLRPTGWPVVVRLQVVHCLPLHYYWTPGRCQRCPRPEEGVRGGRGWWTLRPAAPQATAAADVGAVLCEVLQAEVLLLSQQQQKCWSCGHPLRKVSMEVRRG